MNFSTLCFLLAIGAASVAADCWETSDCQLDSWATKGCAQYGRVEQSNRTCASGGAAGHYYTCCTPPAGTTVPSTQTSGSGTTTRYWDCCKPSCSWDGKAPVTSPVKTCDKGGVAFLPTSTKSGCDGGSAYVCNNNVPFVINNTVAYGFAAAAIIGQTEYQSCCACYEMTFTSGPVVGKKMVVQVTNTGSDLSNNHFDLQIPGGGVGIFNGCQSQWGAPADGWGSRYGGVSSASDCAQLPAQLQAGCNFRFGWFMNADNPSMTFKTVTCPAEITARSGCVRTA